jgi:hypothetical protein
LATRPPPPLPVQGLRPATFVERGVCLPFTTPYLVGARLRPAARDGVELIVANASGGPGVYITSWEGVQSLCSPTLHDRRLNAKLRLVSITSPGALRRVALAVAEEGLAGRPAAAEAKATLAREDRDRTSLNVELLLEMIRAVEQRDRAWTPPDISDGEAVGRRARAALAVLAPRFGRPAEELFELIEHIATAFRAVGVERQAEAARLPRLIADVEMLPRMIGEWPYSRGDDGVLDTTLVQQTVELSVALARTALEHARSLLDDMPRLIRRWLTDKEEVRRLAARPEWLLDGWERICLLWRIADSAFGRPLALREVVNLLPVMPREASDWTRIDVGGAMETLLRRRRTTPREDWRTGITQTDLIARNERLRALAPDGPA